MRWMLLMSALLAAAIAAAGEVDVRDFGAVPNDSLDDSDALQKAWDACQEGDEWFVPSGTYRLSKPLILRANYRVDVKAGSAVLLCKLPVGTSATAITWGSSSSGKQIAQGRFDGPVIENDRGYDHIWDDDFAGLQIVNVSSGDVRLNVIRNFRTGLRLKAEGPNGSVAYSDFHHGHLERNRTSIDFSFEGGKGWANANTFRRIKAGIGGPFTGTFPYDQYVGIRAPKTISCTFRDCQFEASNGNRTLLCLADGFAWSSFEQCWFESGVQPMCCKITSRDRSIGLTVRGGMPLGVAWPGWVIQER